MRRSKSPRLRNQVDLSDPSHRKAWPKRFGLTIIELEEMIDKVGSSVSALTKEVHLRRVIVQSNPEPGVPASVTPTEAA
jgi:Protein of unknown function (DUF3606)